MKKVSAILAALLAVLLLCSCGTPAAPAETFVPEVSTPAEVAPTFLGTMEDKVYKNEYAGLGCTLPEQFIPIKAGELQPLPKDFTDLLEETTLNEEVGELSFVLDLQASAATGASLSVMYQEMTRDERAELYPLSKGDIIKTLLQEQKTMSETYDAAGMEVKGFSAEEMEFLGEMTPCLKTEVTVGEENLTIVQFYNYRVTGKYSVVVTFTATNMEDIQEMISSFFPVDQAG